MSKKLDELEKYRNELLLAEVGAWLHMFGKLQKEFLEGRYYLAREIPTIIKKEPQFNTLNTLLKGKWVGEVWEQLPINKPGTRDLTISRLIQSHDKPMENIPETFLRLMRDAHGRGSGIEKGILANFSELKENTQPSSSIQHNIYKATPLGYEKSIDFSEIELIQHKLYTFLQEELAILENKKAKFTHEDWKNFIQHFRQIIKQYFSITMAETRRPLNDVTLLDQTAMSVAFFKAALAQNVLKEGNWKDPYQTEVRQQYHWRLLRVGLDGFAFWGSSTRIGDILARKECIEQTLNDVQTLLEITYPLGAEIYRDQNGSVFIVPDIGKIEDLPISSETNHSLKDQLQALTKAEGRDKLSGETLFTITPLEIGTRETLQFGKMVATLLPSPKPSVDWLEQQWLGKAKDICSVCHLRPQGPDEKSSDRKVCNVCEKRRLDRSEQWIKGPSTTIWADEVADVNGRLALLVANFNINDWLSGRAFNTIVAFDPQKHQIQIEDKNQGSKQQISFELATLIQDIERGLKNTGSASFRGKGGKKREELSDQLVHR